MGRRAQVEMIGVVIIVIIVISAMLFYLVYKLNNPEMNIKRSYMNKEIATNLLLAMTKTSIKECPTHSLGELITDCTAYPNNRIYCSNVISCEKARQVIESILTSPALADLGKNFTLKVDSERYFSSTCNVKKEKVQGFQILTQYPSRRQIELLLDVCDS